ncbi:hypothetical protein [Bowdeniella massiliensis]|uniref:hypothetical protein n=1 Tax=Bowdeniella massiliensis TaxID=2932264 RepID=UPI00202947FA|nr:hypothetical protein [Bowdeniella massiliensis]
MAINLETLAADLREMSSQDWEAMRDIWSAEHVRRNELAALPGQIDQVADRLRGTERHEPGAEFVPPTSSMDAYMAGETISQDGQVYTCTVDWTRWGPSVLPDAWQATDEGEEP